MSETGRRRRRRRQPRLLRRMLSAAHPTVVGASNKAATGGPAHFSGRRGAASTANFPPLEPPELAAPPEAATPPPPSAAVAAPRQFRRRQLGRRRPGRPPSWVSPPPNWPPPTAGRLHQRWGGFTNATKCNRRRVRAHPQAARNQEFPRGSERGRQWVRHHEAHCRRGLPLGIGPGPLTGPPSPWVCRRGPAGRAARDLGPRPPAPVAGLVGWRPNAAG